VVQGFEGFLNKHLRGKEADLNEIIAVGMALGEEVPYTHAIAILTNPKDDNLIISDSAADFLGCWPAKPPGYGDKPLMKLGNLTDQFIILTLFKIKKDVVSEKHREQLERELRYIMTGKEQTEEIKEKH
jgi:plasmid stability protein